MNIKFEYLYRDGANYKNFHEIIFANPYGIPLQKIQERIKAMLIDATWFVAKDWNLQDKFFLDSPWDSETDHLWHEFVCVEETNREVTVETTISDFLNLVSNSSY